MNFSSDAMADFEGLLEVNRKICKQQMAEKASPTLPTNCAVLPTLFFPCRGIDRRLVQHAICFQNAHGKDQQRLLVVGQMQSLVRLMRAAVTGGEQVSCLA